MFFVPRRYVFFVFSGILVLTSIAALLLYGLKLGIDFTGGSLLEVRFSDGVPDSAAVQSKLGPSLESLSVQKSGPDGLILRFRDVPETTHQEALKTLESFGKAEELRFDSIGPVIGAELKRSGTIAVVLGIIAIMLYIAYAFRAASRPIASWQYGVITAIVALFHDVLIPLGAFAVLGKFSGIEINTPFVAALLTILGYSVHDTIVVFDRVRENLRRFAGDPFPEIVERSLRQTFGRSLNTSLTVLFAVAAIWYFGGPVIEPFALALLIGISSGTYSSIFIASMLLVEMDQRLKRRRI